MRLYNQATGQYTDQPDRSVNAWMRRGWTAVDPEPVVAEDAEETAAEDKSRGKSSARTSKKD